MCKWMVSVLVVAGCASHPLPVEKPVERRARPNWSGNLGLYVDAMRACLETREAPRYVAFVEPLASGAAGISTVDAYGSVEHCAYHDGYVLRREPAPLSAADISDAHGALFSLGPAAPIVQVGVLLEEVLHEGATLGWLYFPPSSEETAE